MTEHEAWIRFRLHEIPSERFEHLCRELLKAAGHTDFEPWGLKGRDGGYDILSRDPEGRLCATQCKRVQKLSKGKAKAELEKMIRLAPDPPPRVVLLATTNEISRDVREVWQETAKTAPFELDVLPGWAMPYFVDALRANEALRRRYVGRTPDEPASLWNVPPRNPFFTGRQAALDQVAEQLASEDAVGLTQAVVGLGGIGKTQIAIEYAHRHQGRYAHSFWVDASSPAALEAGFARIAERLHLVDKGTPTDEATSLFLEALPGLKEWLLILDNADEPDELPKVPTRGGHVLITSRRQHLVRLGVRRPIEVELMEKQEALALLLERSGRTDSEIEGAKRLVDALGRLPLAIEQAGAYLGAVPVPIETYLERFEKDHLAAVEKRGPETGDYEATVRTTWSMSFEKVREASPAAAEALELMAFLAPDSIPLEFFQTSGSVLGPSLAELATRSEEEPEIWFEDLVQVLGRYSLALFDGEARAFSVHRLVQAVVREALKSTGEVRSIFDRLVKGLVGWLPSDGSEPSAWPLADRVLPHLLETTVLAARGSLGTSESALLWNNGGNAARAMGAFRAAVDLDMRSLEAFERLLGPDHPHTLAAKGNLAISLNALGDTAAARPLEEAVLEARERVLGPGHPDTLTAKGNLLVTLRKLGLDAKADALEAED